MISGAILASNAVKTSRGSQATPRTVYSPNLSIHGEDYQTLAKNNPYSTVPYRQSWIQKVLQNLGFRTNYDAYLEGMALQAQEYDNALLQKEYDETYNSPLEQAQREREAGLNPNLTGNVSSGEAVSLPDDANPPVPPQADDLQMITGFAGSVIQGVQAAVGLAGSLTNLAGARLDNNSKLMQFAEDAILHVLPESYEDQSGVDWSNVENYYPKLKSMYGSMMSKRQFRKFVGMANEFAQGLSTGSKKWSLNKERADNRKSYYRAVSGSDYSDNDEVMRAISQPLADMAIELFKERTYADTQKAKNDADYENMVRPQLNANEQTYQQNRKPANEALQQNRGLILDNDLKDENLSMLKYKNSMRIAFDRILKQLDQLSNSGNKLAPIAQMVLSATLMKYLGE